MRWGYLAPVGARPQAVYSPLWLFAERHGGLEEVCLAHSEATLSAALRVEEALKHLVEGARATRIQVPEADVEEASRLMRGVLEAWRARGLKLAVDVTPGRKAMSIAAYKAAVEAGADAVIYLHLLDPSYEGLPVHLIPSSAWSLVYLRGPP
ncbi:MAG: hypothetical protein DRN61_06910 [Thaumarchaeota archaeon]|nr:MAG: hypothetical protein DRN61_06910 [Nitrososphaerota archaeon]